ncbi:MAG: iron-sulfur cluster assembly accessory protein [Rhodospirillales bacterium]|nr:MAG: iron-sulfur cluster assembly accessory protein [Rhodospirillales bacterium]
MLVLTKSAIGAIKSLMTGAVEANGGLRIMVASGGCSGFRYSMGIDEAPQEGDRIYRFGEVRVFVDPMSQPLLAGVNVDFVEDLNGSGFVFENPNAAGKCGCGQSFSCG